MEKKIVIFDFDGTIANTFPIIKEVIKLLASRYGFKTPTEYQLNLFRSKQYQIIIKQLHIPLFKLPFLLQAGRKEMSLLLYKAKIFPGIKRCIQQLINNHFTVGILTSNTKTNVEKFLNRYHIPIAIIYSEFNLFGKDKAINKLTKKYQWDKKQIIYIGDEVRDIEACKKAKIDIIAVSWGFNNKILLSKFYPTLIVKHPSEINRYLSKPSRPT